VERQRETTRIPLHEHRLLMPQSLRRISQVVYGDTDSLFIHMPGRTMQQAHKLGNLIADAVTALNPKPVKLKFEKVRCIQ
jgi:DNA polymerase zeta